MTYFVSMSVTLAGFLFYRRRRHGPTVVARFSRRGLNPVLLLWGVFFMLSTSVVLEPLLSLMPEVPNVYGRGAWAIVTVVVMAPLFEEVIFRGVLLESTRVRYGVVAAWLLSSAIFGIVQVHPTVVVNAFVMGLVLAFIYLRTDSLWSAIILHAINNGIAYLALIAGHGNSMLIDMVGSRTLYVLFYIAALAVFAVSGYMMLVSLRRLKAEGATPDLIQTGNEISYGMLWGAESEGYAKACYPDAPKANWQRFASLLRRATEVCREECPEARIILHTERVSVSQQQDNAHYAALSYFVARAKEYQIDYDILGLSYYPYFHGALSELEGAIRLLESEASDKEVMVVETGYPYAWAVPGTTYDATSTWPYSAEGQRQFVDDLVTMLRRHEAVSGLFWWFMEANERGVISSSPVTDRWYNAPLFDNRTGRATPALSRMASFLSSSALDRVASRPRAARPALWSPDGKQLAGKHPHGLVVASGCKVVVRP